MNEFFTSTNRDGVKRAFEAMMKMQKTCPLQLARPSLTTRSNPGHAFEQFRRSHKPGRSLGCDQPIKTHRSTVR